MSNSEKYPDEWAYWIEAARRFDDEPPERRYGVPKMGAKTWDDMLFESCPGRLFMKFITEGTYAAQVHDNIIKIEIMEGKKHKSILNIRRY
jgi:hypothetical protein